jgi:hypothetical protein
MRAIWKPRATVRGVVGMEDVMGGELGGGVRKTDVQEGKVGKKSLSPCCKKKL